jgi:hypothetical protein
MSPAIKAPTRDADAVIIMSSGSLWYVLNSLLSWATQTAPCLALAELKLTRPNDRKDQDKKELTPPPEVAPSSSTWSTGGRETELQLNVIKRRYRVASNGIEPFLVDMRMQCAIEMPRAILKLLEVFDEDFLGNGHGR